MKLDQGDVLFNSLVKIITALTPFEFKKAAVLDLVARHVGPQWISVDERLPVTAARVLVWRDDCPITIARYDEGKNHWLSNEMVWPHHESTTPTHWQPLTDPRHYVESMEKLEKDFPYNQCV